MKTVHQGMMREGCSANGVQQRVISVIPGVLKKGLRKPSVSFQIESTYCKVVSIPNSSTAMGNGNENRTSIGQLGVPNPAATRIGLVWHVFCPSAPGYQTNILRNRLYKFLFTSWLLLCLVPVLRADTTLVFNEIMYHPRTNEPAMEWVEFYNQMAVDLDVSGWSITNGINYTFPQGTIVYGGAYIVGSISPADPM